MKQLVSCQIEGHVIQKRSSPKKKALDPLRYIPGTCGFLRALHGRGTLVKKFPKSKFPKDVPSMRSNRYDNLYIEEKTNELNQYLDHLLAMPEVKASKILREFLEDSNLSDESDDEDALPTKVLEGLPGTIVSVRAGQTFSVSLDMHHAGDIASWQFSTKKHNIGFSASFNGETVRVYSREEAHAKPVKGSFRCDEPGTLTLDWDNTYTWSKTKASAAEKNEWEHAISTAILAAQLKRRRKSKRLKSADDENIEDLGGGDANPENGESDQDEDDEEGKDDDDEEGKDDDDDSEESESDHEHVLSADKASSVDASDCITV
ncbi:hypothetical protein PINS_up022785 [Pythium insidiosum]|nr:hypothetical protein PINS_up022785 [Pythium insidiosum]